MHFPHKIPKIEDNLTINLTFSLRRRRHFEFDLERRNVSFEFYLTSLFT